MTIVKIKLDCVYMWKTRHQQKFHSNKTKKEKLQKIITNRRIKLVWIDFDILVRDLNLINEWGVMRTEELIKLCLRLQELTRHDLMRIN